MIQSNRLMSHAQLLVFGWLSIILFTFSGCQSVEQQNQATKTVEAESDEDISINLEEDDLFDLLHKSLDALEEEVQEATDNLDAENRSPVVASEDLQAVLPRMLAGFFRKEVEREEGGFANFDVPTANAHYGSDVEYIKVNIVDAGDIPFAKLGFDLLQKADIEFSTEGNTNKNVTIQGYPAFEAYDAKERSGIISLVVQDRFLVTIQGQDVEEEKLMRAAKKLNLKRLERYANT